MPRNGSGTMSRNYSWVTDSANGVNPSPTRFDADANDIASELTNSIAADGQTQPSADLPMNSHKHTAVGNATARTNYAAAGQVQDGALIKVAGVAGTNTITGSVSPAITAYVGGMSLDLVPVNTNTDTATLNINSVGAQTLKKSIGGALVNLAPGDLIAGVPANITFYDATTPVLTNPPPTSQGVDVASAATLNLDAMTGTSAQLTGTTTVTAVTLTNGRVRVLRATGAVPITAGASLVVQGTPSGSTYTCAVGDILRLEAIQSVVYVSVTKLAGGLFRKATTSGTTVDWQDGVSGVSIPSNAKRITINFEGVSTSGSSVPLVQLGTSGGVQNTGYLGCVSAVNAGITGSSQYAGAGIALVTSISAADVLHGSIVLMLSDAANGVWCAQGQIAHSNNAVNYITAGSKSLSGTLDRIRLTTTNGTDTFDAGAASILVE